MYELLRSASLHPVSTVPGDGQYDQESSKRRRAHSRVARWRDQDMLERWLASAWLLTEPNFRKVLSYLATQRRAAAS